MKAIALTLAAVLATLRASSAGACVSEAGSEAGFVDADTGGPDLPLDDFLAGRVGVVLSGWTEVPLALVYRSLTNVPLDDDEQLGALRYWYSGNPSDVTRSPARRVLLAALPVVAPADENASAVRWRQARALVVGDPGPVITPDREDASTAYANVVHCPADAFDNAVTTLAARVQTFSTQSPEVASWIHGADVAFAQCAESTGNPLVELNDAPDTASLTVRTDRAYQIAAALFYAGRYDEARARFVRIGTDVHSPWRPLARYLVARTLVRAAQHPGDVPDDDALLARAESELDTVLTDPSLASVHPAAEHYRDLVRGRRNAPAQLHRLGVRLAAGHVGASLGETLLDYALLFNRVSGSLAAVRNEPDRLGAFVSIVHGEGGPVAFDRAFALYDATRAPVWLVAALAVATDARDPRLDPLLASAASLVPSSAAYVSANYHRLRLLGFRGAPDVARTALAFRDRLDRHESVSTRNLFARIACENARDLDTLMEASVIRPVHWATDDGSVPLDRAPEPVRDSFSPFARVLLEQRVPLDLLVRALHRPSLTGGALDELVRIVLARALVLDRDDVVTALAHDRERFTPRLRQQIESLTQSRSGDARRLAGLRLLLTGLSPEFDPDDWLDHDNAWVPAPWTNYCEPFRPTAPPAMFLSRAERARFTREQAEWERVGNAITYLPNEAVRLATALPSDPLVPEVLHLAVQYTRNNDCPRTALVHRASHDAFTVLHQHYPHSPFAAQTPHWY